MQGYSSYVTTSEAGRRLGMSGEGIRCRVYRHGLNYITIGKAMLVPFEAVRDVPDKRTKGNGRWK